MIHEGKQTISEGEKNMSAKEGKGERNKNLTILSLDVAVLIKADELHVQHDAHSSDVTKSTAVCHWAMPPLIERCCTNECSERFSTFRSHLT
jgi:predicted nucleic acid-binding Zn ribbon protein